jgi:hypothetical protein
MATERATPNIYFFYLKPLPNAPNCGMINGNRGIAAEEKRQEREMVEK